MTELYTGHEVDGCEHCNKDWNNCNCAAISFKSETSEEKEAIRKECAWMFE
jgi:hypothetical protein